MTELRFFFDCYALCAIEREDGYDTRASLCEGLFPDYDAALLASKGVEARLRAEHDKRAQKQQAVYPSLSLSRWPYTPQEYQIVPLKGVTFQSLDHLDTAICAAAVLQASGVSAEIKAVQ